VLSIKIASLGDIPLIRKLTYQVWPQTYADKLSPEQIEFMLEMMYSEASLKKQIAEEGCSFIIVYDDMEPIGFASFAEIAPKIFKIHKIYVLISKQGNGVGRFVMDHIMHQIQKQGAVALQLQVKKDNKAKLFYDKLGFIVIKEIKLDIGKGFFMDDYVMEKKFINPINF